MGTVRLGLAVCMLLSAFAQSVCAATAPTVKTDSGLVSGVAQADVISFKGIPFAKPPVGDLRWRAPQPVSKWAGVRKAEAYGADCMQLPFPSDAAPLGVTPAEDCLYLNVWRPAHPSRGRLPVFVWIYGGGFVNGGSSPDVYDGSEFARHGVMFVSFNYRVGRFGFFAHPALSAEQRGGALANYGIMDQIAALQWVQRNIAAFGGDPGNVTICGESAGGTSVHILLTSRLGRGLFSRAIIQSGGGRPSPFGSRTLSGGADSAEAIGLAFARQAGIEEAGPDGLRRLRALSAQQLIGNLNLASMGDPTYVGGPVVDGKIVTGDTSALYAAGKGARVPVMVGATDMDIGFMPGGSVAELLAAFGTRADEARSAYGVHDGDDVRGVAFRMGGTQMMIEPARYVARLMATRGQPVYEFRFSYVAESLRTQFPGAMHASDIPFAFNTVAARYGKDLTPADAAAARAMHNYFVAFARTGRPQVEGQPAWPAFTPESDIIMNFSNAGPVSGPDPWKRRLDLAEGVSEAGQPRDAH
jgi:para-nitrobenzyl esterase